MPVTGLSLFYLNRILEDVLAITQVDARVVEATRAIHESLDAAAGSEIAFALFRENSYLDQNRRAMEQIRRTRLNGLDHLGEGGEAVRRIPELTAQYDLTLTRLADLYSGPSGPSPAPEELERGLGRLQARLRSLREQVDVEKDPAARRRLFEEMRRVVDSTSEGLLEASRQEDPSRGRLLDQLSGIRGQIDEIAGRIQDRALAHVEIHRQDVVILSNRARRNILVTIVLTGLVGIYLVLFLPSRVVRSLRRITHVLQQAERGDLDVATLETGSDEVGSLAAHLNRALRQLRTFDEIKTERMLRAEIRLGTLVENLETGVILVDDQVQPVFASRRARHLLGPRPEGADDARIAGLLVQEEFSSVLKEALESQTRQEPRVLNVDGGSDEYRRLRVWADPVADTNGEVREILLFLRPSA